MITSSELVANTIAGTPTESKLDRTRIPSAPTANMSGKTIPRAPAVRSPARAESRRGNHAAHAARIGRPVPERVVPRVLLIGAGGDRDQVEAVRDPEHDASLRRAASMCGSASSSRARSLRRSGRAAADRPTGTRDSSRPRGRLPRAVARTGCTTTAALSAPAASAAASASATSVRGAPLARSRTSERIPANASG